jgi:hypothetical protein
VALKEKIILCGFMRVKSENLLIVKENKIKKFPENSKN